MTYPIKAVVFDWAGTVIDHGCCAPVAALQRVFAGQAIEITAAEVRLDMGRAKRDHIGRLLAMPRIARLWAERHRRAWTDADADRLHDAVEPLMIAAAKDCAGLIPGVLETVADLRGRGIRIGSCTGYTRPMMAEIMPLAAAAGYRPDAVVCAGETPSGRPSPLMLWKVLVELDVWPAWRAIKVDDAPVGISEGRAAGAWTVGVSATGNGVGLDEASLGALEPNDRRARIAQSADLLRVAGADYVVESVAGVPAILDLIAARLAAGDRPTIAQ